ncbi:MAG: XylR family transcriptional regulator [Sedimentisphaerales bacterium]|nr:XylR family transcriptional regulator [Sedimentisphaerales bacterium]
MLSRLKKWDADGIVMREPKESREILALGLPTIMSPFTTEQFPEIPKFLVDCDAVGRMAAEHLLNRGFQHYAFCGFNNMFWSRDRGESFTQHINKAGYEVHNYNLPERHIMLSWEKEQPFMMNWLKSLPKPVAIMACNDDRGRHVIEACKIMGLPVPEDITILGVGNDDMICDLSNPPLSSIARNHERAGYEIAELLDKLMAGEKMADQRIIVQPLHVVTRHSTDILAIKDREVAEAVRFIRIKRKKPIQVNDVVDAVGISRRSLELRFRKELGKSVLNEIQRVRTDLIARMLVETNLSILQISLALGYTSEAHIARYFQQQKGMSLLAYRTKYGQK